MDFHRYVRAHLADITGNAARDEEIVEELAQHLAQRFDEVRASGLSDADALAAVNAELRGNAQLAHMLRDADRRRPIHPLPPTGRSAHMLADLWQDLRYATRLLRRTPAFTVAAVATLALGIGMTTAIFSVIDGVLLRPLPYPDADRLVMLWETDRKSNTMREPGSFPDFLDYRQRSQVTDRIGAFVAFDADLQPDHADPIRVAGLAATPDVFAMLGVRPLTGRSFTMADDGTGAAPTVLISERLWNAAFARAAIVGQAIRLNDRPRIVVGIVPTDADVGLSQILRAANYGGGFATRDPRIRVDVWTPLQGSIQRWPRYTHPILMMGLLKRGVDRTAAQGHLGGIAADLEREFRNENDGRGISIQSLATVIVGPVETPLMMLLSAVGLVLLMACVNVANLLLTRGTRRMREVAVRSALGAETKRLARQFVVENIVLATTAGALALLVAFVVLRALIAIAPGDIPRLASVGINGRVILVAFACAAASGLAFSIVPVWQSRRRQLQTILRTQDAHGTTGREGQMVRSTLVVAEVAFAVLLVTGAGLVIKSFWRLQATNPGFDFAAVVKAEFSLPGSRYPMQQNPLPVSPAIARFNDALLRRVSAMPGVQAAAFAANHPLDGGFASSFRVVGREAEGRNWPEISIRLVSPGYFGALRVPIVRGRAPDERDADPKQKGVVVNQIVVDRFFGADDPIGAKIGFWGSQWTIVGVVGNERFQGLAKDPPIAVYLPLGLVSSNAEALIVRTSGDPSALTSAVRAAIREQDPLLVVFGLEPLEQTVASSIHEQRFLMLLLALFAALALSLAAIGIHGVLSCIVAQRQREIGIRMALGASATRVVRAVVTQGVRLTVIGVVIGLVLAVAFARFIAALLFGVGPTDVATFASVVVVLAMVAAVSVWLPARRAVRIDPLVALRQE